MPTSIHKFLIHELQIVSTAILSVGQLSEEYQETINKYIKEYKKNFSKISSYRNTMEDVFSPILIASDF